MVRALHILLWVLQVVAALVFFWGAFAKLVQPAEEAARVMPWVRENRFLAIFTGLVDLAVGLGLILPMAFRIMPFLTFWAAIGGYIVLVLAIVFDWSRDDSEALKMQVGLLFILGWVAWGRYPGRKGKIP